MSSELKIIRELLLLIDAKIKEFQDFAPPITRNDPNPEWSEEAREFLEDADYEQ